MTMRFDNSPKAVNIASVVTADWLYSIGCRRDDGGKFDANETANFTRGLEYIFSETYDVEYPDNVWRTLVETDSRVSNGAESYTYRQFDKFGEADFIDNMADDFPLGEVQGLELSKSIKSIGSSYRYTVQEMRGQAVSGIPLDQMKAAACRMFIENKLEVVTATGDTKSGLIGLLNDPNVPVLTVAATGTGASKTWASKTVAQIDTDVNQMQLQIFNATLGQRRGDTLILDLATYGYGSTTARSVTFTDDNILDYLLKKNKSWLKRIVPWNMATGAGAAATNRAMLYCSDKRTVSHIISQEFEQMPPQQKNMALVVNCHARTGGVEIRYPKACAYADGFT